MNKDSSFMTETYLKVGKSVLKTLFEYNKSALMNDESEFFPLLSATVNGVIAALANPEEKENVKNCLTVFVRDEYIKTWIQNSKEDENKPDIEQETKEAAKYFDNSYNS